MIKTKNKTQYVCSSCSAKSIKWGGQCFSCKDWNTFGEVEVIKKQSFIPRISPKKKEQNKLPDHHQEELDKWFDARIEEAKVHPFCEECGKSVANQLNSKDTWVKRACIAHIFAKRKVGGFQSVSCHELNWVLLCVDCHHHLDSSFDKARKMKVWELVVRKAKMFSHLITEKRGKITDELFVD